MLKNLKIAVKISILATLVLIVGFFVLWKIIDDRMTETVDSQIANQMSDAVESRTYIINDYVKSAEEYMIAFSTSDEVKQALNNPDDKAIIRVAQQFTEEFANVKGYFEGIYIATPQTLVLTHSNPSFPYIGKYMREGDKLREMQEEILATPEMKNAGIIAAPQTGNLIISMYYPVYENGKCIGYIGGAVYASELTDSLVSLDVEGLEESEYVFLNAATGTYMYNENEELLNTVTEDKGYLEMIEKVADDNGEHASMFEYVDDEGIERVVAYKYIPERNWVFALRDTKANVYASLEAVKKLTGGVCVMMAIIVIIMLNLILSGLGRQLKLISGSIEKLGNMDLNANENLKRYSGRGDEIGIVCDALDKTCTNLKKYIGEVDSQLAIMSQGDFTGGTSQTFAGEFIKLQDSMTGIRSSLRDSFWKINTITSELVLGAQSVADSSSNLASAASKANSLLAEIDDNVNGISKELDESADFATNAKNQANEATVLVKNGRVKMDELSDAMHQIEEATKAIEGISNNLEGISKQTNILALNALVEATRAGDAGRGFGVVADEIRVLAAQANDAANNAYELINQTIERVREGMKIGEETARYLDQVVTQTETIDGSVGRIAESAVAQNEKLHRITDRLGDISQSVEVTAAMAQQCAAASTELDDQINSLRDNINGYRI